VTVIKITSPTIQVQGKNTASANAATRPIEVDPPGVRLVEFSPVWTESIGVIMRSEWQLQEAKGNNPPAYIAYN
jgi:hypothetical protein